MLWRLSGCVVASFRLGWFIGVVFRVSAFSFGHKASTCGSQS